MNDTIWEQAETCRTIIDSLSDHAVIVNDSAGTITYWNQAAERILGWSADEAQGSDILELLSDAGTQAEGAKIIARLRRGERWAGEFSMRRRDGTTFPAYMIDSPLRDENGALVGVVGVSVDMTERKRIEEVQREARDLLEIQVAARTTELQEVNQQLARWA